MPKSAEENCHTFIAQAWNHLLLVPPTELLRLLTSAVKKHFSIAVSEHDIRHFLLAKADAGAVPIASATSATRRVLRRRLEVEVNSAGQMKGGKPRSFSIGGETRLVNSWKELLVDLCEIIASQNKADFPLVIEHIQGKRRRYFSNRPGNLTDARSVPGTNFFVEANLAANNIKSLCDALSQYFGYGPEVQLQFWSV
jgi:negative regulator of replication initiation